MLGFFTACIEWKHAEAESSYKRSLELNPNDPMALQHYSINRMSAGEVEHARKLAERAREIDPLSDYIQLCVAFPDFYSARYDRVLARISKFSEGHPPFLWGLWTLWRTYSLVQRRAEAVEVCKKVFAAVSAPIVVEAMERAGVDHAFDAAASTMAEILQAPVCVSL